MNESKQNDLGNFSKLLKKLQMENLALPELRQLKQEHAYLQKLKQQRTKIEQLKFKYDSTQSKLQSYVEENNNQRFLIQQQHKTIKMLQQKLIQAERKKSQYESGVIKSYEVQKQKLKNKMVCLSQQAQQIRKECKLKDLQIFEMEDQMEQRLSHAKDQYLLEKKKILSQCDQKLKNIQSEGHYRQEQTQELKQLVTRQHKALQLQNQQYEQLNQQHEQLASSLQEIEEQLAHQTHQKEEAEERVSQLSEVLSKMQRELSQRRNGANAKQQIEQLRKVVGQMAKGEIEKIEFIVSEFQ